MGGIANKALQLALQGDPIARELIRIQNESLLDNSVSEIVKSGRARTRVFSGNNYSTTTSTVTAGANNVTNAGFFVRVGFKFLLTNLSLFSDGECIVRSRITPDSDNRWAPYVSNTSNSNQLSGYAEISSIFGVNGGSISVPLGEGIWIPENSTFTNVYATSGTVSRKFSFIASGYEIPIDILSAASLKIAVGLDSNTAGANLGNDTLNRPYLSNTQWQNRLVQLGRQAGVDTGIWANWANDGKTYEDFGYGLVTGQWGGKFDRLILMGGTNDAASTKYTSPSQLADWIQRICDWRDNMFGNEDKRILFCGPITTDDPDRLGGSPSRIASVRDTIKTKVESLITGGNTKISYLDCSTAVPLAADATTDLNWKERVAGSRVHLSGLGSTILGQYVFDQKKNFLFGL